MKKQGNTAKMLQFFVYWGVLYNIPHFITILQI